MDAPIVLSPPVSKSEAGSVAENEFNEFAEFRWPCCEQSHRERTEH